MCRLVAYLGEEVLLSKVLIHPSNSIVMQSLHAKESDTRTNGDGFGLGWYMPSISAEPALFTSTFPAWNDQNLLHLTKKTKSNTFFAHVRAATSGGVSQYNCHPFVYHNWMLMHNGDIPRFVKIKRHLRRLLEDDIYNWVKGDTDSEHVFALFLQLAKQRDLSQLSVVASTLQETFAIIADLIKLYEKNDVSYFNVCLTDGKRLVASRYCTAKKRKPETLHFSINNPSFSEHITPKSILISSEKLTNINNEWQQVPPNHFLTVDHDVNVVLTAM